MRLGSVSEIKGRAAGDVVTFRAQALRFWDVAGTRMALVGDESALTRIELGDRECEAGVSYEFRNLVVREYPGGWHSASVAEGSDVVALTETVTLSQDEAYIERTFKILTGVQRRKARKEGRLPPWKHPGSEASGGTR
ncbi:MAG TPA: hypothetical protein VFP63_07470 [Dehalococcoidia bacterium]|nr:hypothetical protein [Dehalococcoidia bacterium]